MTLLRLEPAALARSRFALSPFAETLASVLLLVRPAPPPPWAAVWHRRQAPALHRRLAADPFARGLLGLVSATKWLPAFVAQPPPAPAGTGTRFEDELPAVTRFGDAEFRAEVARSVPHSWTPQRLDWLEGRDLAARTGTLFHDLWREHVAADWPRRRLLLERDITYRAGVLAAEGWPAVLHRMTRQSAWVAPDAIRFSNQAFPDLAVGPDGLLFVPVTTATGTWVCDDDAGRLALVYQGRGAGAADADAPGDGDRSARALARLLGPVRAAILRELERPASVSELTALLGVSLGTVGGHLAVLREAGLVTWGRVGRRVVYRRTERGASLAAVPPEASDG